MATKEKIIKTLEENPSGLSISELARKTGLHRNTVSPNVAELLKEGELKYKMVGQAKVYYLSYDHGLHGGIKMDEDKKNVYAGVGISGNDDSYLAGKEAAEMAIKECGKEPTFGLVFVSERYDHEKLVKGLDTIFKDVPYCGCTGLGEVTKRGTSHNSCVVMALSSRYIHVGIGTGENVYKKPKDAIKRASNEALSKIKLDTYVDPYITYLAMKKKVPKDLLAMRPYRLLVITPGFGDKIPLDQEEIIKGLFEEVGMYTPIIGAGAISSSMVTNKYVFTNKKVFDDAVLVVAMVSMVKTGSSIAHGFMPTGKTCWINKGESSLAFELNNRSAKEVYKELNNIDLDKWTLPFGKEGGDLNSREMHTYIKHPFGIQTPGKNYIIRNILPIFPDKDFIRFSSLVEPETMIIQMEGNEDRLADAGENAGKLAIKNAGSGNIAAAIIFSCALRQLLMGENAGEEIKRLQEVIGKDTPLIGVYCAGELGAFEDSTLMSQEESISVFLITGDLLSDEKG